MKDLILKRNGCTEQQAEWIVEDLKKISPQLKGAVEKWLKDETVDPSLEVEGFTLGEFMSPKYNMKFTGAILTLDWLIKEPDEAKKALKYGVM